MTHQEVIASSVSRSQEALENPRYVLMIFRLKSSLADIIRIIHPDKWTEDLHQTPKFENFFYDPFTTRIVLDITAV